MSDLISRENAIKAIEDYFITLINRKISQIDTVDAAVDIKRIIEKLPAEQEWIPVEYEIPPTSDYVLLSFANFSQPMPGRYECDKDGSGAWYVGDCDEEDTCVANNLFVNAWQPLPKPYREE